MNKEVLNEIKDGIITLISSSDGVSRKMGIDLALVQNVPIPDLAELCFNHLYRKKAGPNIIWSIGNWLILYRVADYDSDPIHLELWKDRHEFIEHYRPNVSLTDDIDIQKEYMELLLNSYMNDEKRT